MGLVQNFMKTTTKDVQPFIAFAFLTFTIGMLFALYIIDVEPLLLFVPPLLGLTAFYDKKLSYFLFAIIVIFVFV